MDRNRFMFAVRERPAEAALRRAIAVAYRLDVSDVRELREDADPAVRYECHDWPIGFRLVVDLFVDPHRAPLRPMAELAVTMSRVLGHDIAHHDGSTNPGAYILVRPNGQRITAWEIETPSAWLVLDEDHAP